MDISINHSLINRFGFDRKELSIQKDLCWIDTIFKNIPATYPCDYRELHWKYISYFYLICQCNVLDGSCYLANYIGSTKPTFPIVLAYVVFTNCKITCIAWVLRLRQTPSNINCNTPDLFLVILVLQDLEQVMHSVFTHGTVVSPQLLPHQDRWCRQVVLHLIILLNKRSN